MWASIKARPRLKRMGGHHMDDQFGQELFPGTNMLNEGEVESVANFSEFLLSKRANQ